jgi:CRP-like cAMP-binding protein
VESIPNILKLYAYHDLAQKVHTCFAEVNLIKDQFIFRENQESSKYFYIVKSGDIMLYKKVKYQDQHDKFHQKEIAVIQLGAADIIGENALIHGWNYVYTYKVVSVNCELYRLDIKYFKTWFFECLPLIDKLTKKRKALVLERTKKIVEMQEYACFKYGRPGRNVK